MKKRKMFPMCGTPILQINEMIKQKKIEDETFRTLNQFEKIIKKKDTFENLIQVRRMYRNRVFGFYGYYRSLDKVMNNQDLDLHNLIKEYQEEDTRFCYVKFVSDTTKPGLRLSEKDKEDKLKMVTVPIDFKYGIIVYYVKNDTLHRFLFAPVIESDCDDYYLQSFYIIGEHRQYNYIKIDKPVIKKEMKRNSSLKLLIKMENGGYCSIPENKLRKREFKLQGLINKFDLSYKDAEKLNYYNKRKCPRCKKGKTEVLMEYDNSTGNSTMLIKCDKCGYKKTFNDIHSREN